MCIAYDDDITMAATVSCLQCYDPNELEFYDAVHSFCVIFLHQLQERTIKKAEAMTIS